MSYLINYAFRITSALKIIGWFMADNLLVYLKTDVLLETDIIEKLRY